MRHSAVVIVLTYAVVLMIFATPYVVNLVKLTNCDWEKDYVCEVVHGVGTVIPPVALITVWFASDEAVQ